MDRLPDDFEFQIPPHPKMLDEIKRLELDGYVLHKEWENGIELRKKNMCSDLGLLVRCMAMLCCTAYTFPFFFHTILDRVFGYRYQAFVTRSAENPEVGIY
jgi:hypothetical protein